LTMHQRGAFSYQEQNRHFSDSKEELQIQNDWLGCDEH
ncbi:hypothetical protein ECP02999174_5623, partial [Escherichia coli P0299917.4]